MLLLTVVPKESDQQERYQAEKNATNVSGHYWHVKERMEMTREHFASVQSTVDRYDRNVGRREKNELQ